MNGIGSTELLLHRFHDVSGSSDEGNAPFGRDDPSGSVLSRDEHLGELRMKTALNWSDPSAAACAVASSPLKGGLGPWRGGKHGFDALKGMDSDSLREV
eukprot:16444476-Heterocapsa_arctica.AAC.1